METPADKEAARKAMEQRMKRVKNKLDILRKI